MVASVKDIVHELKRLDVIAAPTHGPSDVWIAVRDDRGGGSVVLACDFNVSGWEAAWNPDINEQDHDQRPIHAWLSADADAGQVALWAAALSYDPRRCLDAESHQLPA